MVAMVVVMAAVAITSPTPWSTPSTVPLHRRAWNTALCRRTQTTFGWVVTGCGVAAVTTGAPVAGSLRTVRRCGANLRGLVGVRLHHHGPVFRNRRRVPALKRSVRRCSRHGPILGNGRNGVGAQIAHALSSLRRHKVCVRRRTKQLRMHLEQAREPA